MPPKKTNKKSERISVAVTPQQKEKLEALAKASDSTVSEVVEKRILRGGITSTTDKALRPVADALGLAVSDLADRILKAVIGRQRAAGDVWGDSPEFFHDAWLNHVTIDVGIDTELSVYHASLREFEQARLDDLLDMERYAPELLTQEDREFLINKRAGRTWNESAEKAAEDKRRAEREQKRRTYKIAPHVDRRGFLDDVVKIELEKRYAADGFGVAGTDEADAAYIAEARRLIDEALLKRRNHDNEWTPDA